MVMKQNVDEVRKKVLQQSKGDHKKFQTSPTSFFKHLFKVFI